MSSSRKDKEVNLSDALAITGSFSRFQVILFVLFVLSSVLAGLMTCQFQVLAIMQNIQCVSDTCKVAASTQIPLEKTVCDLNKHEWKFSETKSNWLTQFELICEKQYLIDLETTIYFTGFFASVSMLGILCDRYGRRIISISCLAGYIGTLVLLKYALELDKILLFRFIFGCLHGGISVSIFTSVVEFTLQQSLWFCSVFGSVAFSVGRTLMAYIAFERDQWQSTLDIPICIAITAFVLCYFVIPETPYWFYANSKELQALVSLNEVAIINRSLRLKGTTTLTMHKGLKEDHFPDATCSVTLKTEFTRTALIYLSVCWFTSFTCYFTLQYNTGSTAVKDSYLPMMAAGISDVPFKVIMFFAGNKFGRKKVASVFFVLMALAMAIGSVPVTVMDGFFSPGTLSAKTVLVLFGQGCAGSLLPLLSVYTCEIVPTLSRSSCLAVCLMVASSSSLLCPFAEALDQLNPISNYVITVILAILSLLAIQRVPETLNNPLPNNLTECELLFSTKKAFAEDNIDDLEMETLLSYNTDDE